MSVVSLNVTARNDIGDTDAHQFTVIPVLPPLPVFTAATPPNCIRGNPYPGYQFAATSLLGVKFEVVTGKLPDGLSMDGSGKIAAGQIPTKSGAFSAGIGVRDAANQLQVTPVTIYINKVPPHVDPSAVPPVPVMGQPWVWAPPVSGDDIVSIVGTVLPDANGSTPSWISWVAERNRFEGVPPIVPVS